MGSRRARRSWEVLSLVAFLLCSAAVLLVAVLFPMSDKAPLKLGVAMLVVALVMAGGTYALGNRLPRSALLAEAVVMAVLNSVLVAKAHTTGGAIGDAVAYGWLMVYVAAFFPGAAPAFAALVAVAYGLGLLAGGLPNMLAPWALIALTCATAGMVLSHVSRLVRRHIETDMLTGALNRAGLHAAAGRASTGRARAAAITVAAVDLDSFKQINDREGHAEGDRLLAGAVAAWRDALRGEDILARVGGDEFVIVMPGTTLAEASIVLDRLRATHPVAWSAGLAEWRPGESLDACLERADRSLYDAKPGRRHGDGPATSAPDQSPRGARRRRTADVTPPAQDAARRGLLRTAADVLPRGRSLSSAEWQARHRAAFRPAAAALVLGCAYAALRGAEPAHIAMHAVAGAALLAIGARARVPRTIRAVSVSLALMAAAALVVHAAHGATEAHFLFFVFVPIAALYVDWFALGSAVGFVFVHHLGLGLLAHGTVFAQDAMTGRQVLIHTGFVLAACAASLVEWRMTEDRLLRLREQMLRGSADLRSALSDVDAAHAETVRRLSMALEFRDRDTARHTDRIGRRSRLLALAAGLEPDVADLIGYAAPLHDAGKVAVPDAVLLKPGRLTPEERAIMETHAEQGHRLLRGSSSAILEKAASIAWTHHERWDGTGYPRRLAGEEIPVEGRIVAIVDVFDALTSDRVYRDAMPRDRALQIMRDGRGTHFDPELLDVFLDVMERVPDTDAVSDGLAAEASDAGP